MKKLLWFVLIASLSTISYAEAISPEDMEVIESMTVTSIKEQNTHVTLLEFTGASESLNVDVITTDNLKMVVSRNDTKYNILTWSDLLDTTSSIRYLPILFDIFVNEVSSMNAVAAYTDPNDLQTVGVDIKSKEIPSAGNLVTIEIFPNEFAVVTTTFDDTSK